MTVEIFTRRREYDEVCSVDNGINLYSKNFSNKETEFLNMYVDYSIDLGDYVTSVELVIQNLKE